MQQQGDSSMIENDVKTTTNVTTSAATSNTTSPISASYEKKAEKEGNAFWAWLNDKDTVEEKNGTISVKTAATSYAKGLIEVVKALYKKPILSIATIACGAALTFYAQASAFTVVMALATAAGAAGMIYAGFVLANPKTSNNARQAYEVLGISTFVLGLGIYGLTI